MSADIESSLHTRRATLPQETQPEHSAGSSPVPVFPAPVESFAILKQFVREAAQADIHSQVLPQRRETPRLRLRRWNVLFAYALTDFTLEEIGDVYGLTKERIRQVVKKAAIELHQASPLDLQETYPRESFHYGKPLFERNLHRRSTEPSKVNVIFRASLEGKPIEDIQKLGVHGADINRARIEGRRRGISVPYKTIQYSPEFKTALRDINQPTTSEDEKQRVLDLASKDLLEKLSRDEEPSIIKLSELLHEADLRVVGKRSGLLQIVSLLRNLGIPVGLKEREVVHPKAIQRYGYITATYRKTVLEVLRTHPDLVSFRSGSVGIVGGHAETFPTSYEIRNRNEFQPLMRLIGNNTLHLLGKRGITIQEIMEDSPVPLFEYASGYYVSTANVETLKTFLEHKIASLE